MLTASAQAGAAPAAAGRRFDVVTVVGAGLMGRRLAGVFAGAGLEVRLTDRDAEMLPTALEAATELAGRSAEARAASPGAVHVTSDLTEAVSGSHLVTEAIVEDLNAKQALFGQLATLAPEAVLASNSSVLRISDIGARLEDPSRAVGTHWWNPPDLIPIVEVIHGEHTAPDVVDDVLALMVRLGKVPVRVRRDVPGFVGNRLQHALWREAIALVAGGVCDAETVDLVVRGTIGLRLAQMGPLQNADYVGLDLTRAIHHAVLPALDRSETPSALLDELIGAGHLGAKTGHGFFDWPAGSVDEARAALDAHVTAAAAHYRASTTHQEMP